MKTLIRLRGCTSWSGHLFSAYARRHVFARQCPIIVFFEDLTCAHVHKERCHPASYIASLWHIDIFYTVNPLYSDSRYNYTIRYMCKDNFTGTKSTQDVTINQKLCKIIVFNTKKMYFKKHVLIFLESPLWGDCNKYQKQMWGNKNKQQTKWRKCHEALSITKTRLFKYTRNFTIKKKKIYR